MEQRGRGVKSGYDDGRDFGLGASNGAVDDAWTRVLAQRSLHGARAEGRKVQS